MVVPNWLLRETFMVEHNPNCPSPFLVRLVGKGKGYIRRNSDDVRGYGQTLEDAATMAMKLAGKFTAVETTAAPPCERLHNRRDQPDGAYCQWCGEQLPGEQRLSEEERL